jgi:excisionase family DNA binding protein
MSRKTQTGSTAAPTAQGKPRAAPEAFYTINEVAELLGVSSRTVHRWIEQKVLVVHRFGAVVRVADTDFEAFIAVRRDI